MGRKLVGRSTLLLLAIAILSAAVYQLIPPYWQQSVLTLLRTDVVTLLGVDISVGGLLLCGTICAAAFWPLRYLWIRIRRLFALACRAQRWRYVRTGLLCLTPGVPGVLKAISGRVQGAAAAALGSSLDATVFHLSTFPVRVWHIITAIALVAVVGSIIKRK